MRAPFKVLSADQEDIYRDIARIPQTHRGEIKEGTMCRISCNGKTSYVALRGSPNHEEVTIKLDDKTRNDLSVKTAETYDFELEPLNFFMQFCATWHASDPYSRIAMRLSLISFALGIIGLALGIVAFF